MLYEEHDALLPLRVKAEKRMLAEARKHREWRLLKTCPGLGSRFKATMTQPGGRLARKYDGVEL